MMCSTWVLTVGLGDVQQRRRSPRWKGRSRPWAVPPVPGRSARRGRCHEGPGAVAGRCGRKRLIRRRVVEGRLLPSRRCGSCRMASQVVPRRRSISAGTRWPRPAAAANTYSSRSKVVRMRTRGRSAAWQILPGRGDAVHASGIRTSMTITSAGSSCASRTAAWPWRLADRSGSAGKAESPVAATGCLLRCREARRVRAIVFAVAEGSERWSGWFVRGSWGIWP